MAEMSETLFWLYFITAILLIDHEIDSAYWKEWRLFGLPGGIGLFLVLHFPILAFVLYGLILVYEGSFWGLIFAGILGISGVFAFSIHTFFLKKGRPEFKAPISIAILVALLITSVAQLVYCGYLFLSI
jgi:hypothetical protein